MKQYAPIFPGDVSPLVSLNDCLRDTHEAVRAAELAEIARRQKAGASLSTDVDWRAVEVTVEEIGACSRRGDAAETMRHAGDLRLQLAGKFLEDPGEFKSVEGLDDVRVRFIAIADRVRREHMRDIAAAYDGDDTDAAAGQTRRDAAIAAFLRATVREVHMGERVIGGAGLTEADLEAVLLSGVWSELYVAARDYQRLSPGKGFRFGSPAPST